MVVDSVRTTHGGRYDMVQVPGTRSTVQSNAAVGARGLEVTPELFNFSARWVWIKNRPETSAHFVFCH